MNPGMTLTLVIAAWATLSSGVAGQSPPADGSVTLARTPTRPNVVLIIADDLNDWVEGMGGHPQAHTPNLSRLAARGVLFTNAHCNSPLCAPSRASLLTGLYPSTTGYYGFDQTFNLWRDHPGLADAKTLVQYFEENGYRTLGTGKVFHVGHEDKGAFAGSGGFATYGPQPAVGPFPWDGLAMAARSKIGSYRGTGHPSVNADFATLFDSFAPLSDVPTIPPDPLTGAPGHSGWMMSDRPFRFVNADDRDLLPDEAVAAWAAEQLGTQADEPFLMVVGMLRPHTPLYAPKEFFDLFPLHSIAFPPYLKNDLDDVPEILWKDPRTDRPKPSATKLQRVLKVGGAHLWKQWIQAYLACVAFLDAQVGVVLDALDRSEHAESTIVIFISDHGMHLGEKNTLFKNTLWEESTRIPLIVVAPEVTSAAGRCDTPVSLIDVYPTLLELCGLPLDPNRQGNGLPLDGHSLVPLLREPSSGTWAGPPVALCALAGDEPVESGEPGLAIDQHFSVRSRRYRYTRCSNGREELYDLMKDPNSWTNVAQVPQYQLINAEMRRQLVELVGSSPYIAPTR
jgi:arylsulfatase A-like enzyme